MLHTIMHQPKSERNIKSIRQKMGDDKIVYFRRFFFQFDKIVSTDRMTCAKCVALSYWTFLFFILNSFIISYQYRINRSAFVQMHSFSMVWSNSRFSFFCCFHSFAYAFGFQIEQISEIEWEKKSKAPACQANALWFNFKF